MSEILAHLTLVLVVCAMVSLFYWHVFRPVVMQALRYRLFESRDALRSLAVSSAVNHRSHSYAYLENLINKTIAIMPMICLVKFVHFAVTDRSGPSKELIGYKEEATPELEKLRLKTAQHALMIMGVNSPITVVLALIIAFVLWLCGKISKMMVVDQAESFLEGMQIESSPTSTPSLSPA